MELKELINRCIEKWNRGKESDEKIKIAKEYFEQWFSNIPKNYQSMVEILIKNLEYFTRITVNIYLVELHKELLEKGKLSEEDTIYTFIKSKDGISNSSNDYWTEYKILNSVNNNICFEDIKQITNEQWACIKNIVFIDDFCGTGNTFIEEIEKFKDKYFEKKIFFIIIVATEEGLKKIKKYEKDNNLLIIPLYKFVQKKAFEQNLFITDDESAKQSLISLSNELKIPEKHHLGYGESQSLVAFYNNTPNNTIGLIRYDTLEYKSLFPRKNDRKPSWQTMGKEKKERKMTNYNSKVGKGKKYE